MIRDLTLRSIMDSDRLQRQIEFIAEIDKAKSVIRQTSLIDGSRQENDAEHSWHIAVMAMLLSEYSNEPVDTFKVVKMLLIHDLVEIDAGDTFLYDGSSRDDKFAKETEAAERIFSVLPKNQADEMLELWNEFEAGRTSEARFAKALDLMQPVLQGYFNKGWSWQHHGLSMSLVMQMKEPIEEGSERLWEFTQNLLRDALEKGFFPKE